MVGPVVHLMRLGRRRAHVGMCACLLAVVGVPLAGTSTPAAAGVVTATPSVSGMTSAAVAGREPTRLHTAGGYFRDSLGRVVLLHGVNLVDKGPAATAYPAADANALGFTAKDAAFLRQSGFNVVRLGINWSQLLPDRPTDPHHFVVKAAYLDKVVRVARLMAVEKIFVLLDLHQDCWQEWPQWAVPYDKGDTSPLPFPLCYFAPNAASRAADNLFRLPDPDAAGLPAETLTTIPVAEVWSIYREVWRQIALRFRNEDYLLGYDFMNEPSAGSGYAACFDLVVGCQQIEQGIQAFEQNALDGIREADPAPATDSGNGSRAGIGMFEPPSIAGTTGAPTGMGNTPVIDPQVAWTFHQYCGSAELANDRDVGCAETVTPSFEGTNGLGGAVRNAAHLTGADITAGGGPRRPGAEPAPAFLGEFGSSTQASVLVADMGQTDSHFMSWTLWHYKDGHGGQDSIFESAEDERCVCFRGPSARADVLIRPYPQVTAGTPVSLKIDGAGRSATYVFRPNSTTLPTEAVVPTHFAPRGYQTRVVGAVVTSAPNARLLTLRATSASEVTVTIVARQGSISPPSTGSSAPRTSGSASGSPHSDLADTGSSTGMAWSAVAMLGGLAVSRRLVRRRSDPDPPAPRRAPSRRGPERDGHLNATLGERHAG
jgi:endoglycosylceramidase